MTLNWVTYVNDRFGFSMRYPADVFAPERRSEAGDSEVTLSERRGQEVMMQVARLPGVINVWKDPNCDCCTGWIEHLRRNGFTTTVVEIGDMQAVKTRHSVPAELAACHTAEIAGYIIEGHVQPKAITRCLPKSPMLAVLR